MRYVPRAAGERFERLLREFPVVLVIGPRQCGKSTLVRALRPAWRSLDMERAADLAFVQANIEGFFRQQPRHVVIDEAQRLPDLFPALRHFVDQSAGRGRYLLTGSVSPALMRKVSESPAGRVGMLELTTFRSTELAGGRHEARRWF